ncbi:MAG: hypothetical protein HC905_24210 [Bacteroidales bacterium]|nr:hypothetical protein [Bacteroidales bacterium]
MEEKGKPPQGGFPFLIGIKMIDRINTFLSTYYKITLKQLIPFIILFTSFGLIYLLLNFIFHGDNPLKNLFYTLHDSNLNTILTFSTFILKIFSYPVHLEGFSLFLNNEPLITLNHTFLTYRWSALAVFLIIATPSSFRPKIYWIVFALLLTTILYSLKLIVWIIIYEPLRLDVYSTGKVAQAIMHSGYFIFILLWIYSKRNYLQQFF